MATETKPDSDLLGLLERRNEELETLVEIGKALTSTLDLREDGTFEGFTGCRRFDGDWIEVGMMGAYSSALRTDFNGFADCHTVLLDDAAGDIGSPNGADENDPPRRPLATDSDTGS